MLLRRCHRIAAASRVLPAVDGAAAACAPRGLQRPVFSCLQFCPALAHGTVRFAGDSTAPAAPDVAPNGEGNHISADAAAKAGDVEALKALVAASGLAALRTSEAHDAGTRLTVVQAALIGGSVATLEFLLQQLGRDAFVEVAGAPVNDAVNDAPTTAMLRVALLGCVPRRVLDFLFSNVLDGNATPALGKQLAVYAAVEDCVAGFMAVTSLFGEDDTVDAVELMADDGTWLSVAHVAARHGAVSMLEHLGERFGLQLLETGTRQGAAAADQLTPAGLAAMAGRVASLEFIESRIGADVMAGQRFRGMALAQVAVASGQADAAAFLESRPGGEAAMNAITPPDNLGVAHVAVASSSVPLEMLEFVAGLPYGQRLLHARCVHGGTIAHYAALANCPLAVFEAIERHAGRPIFAVKNLHDETALDLVEEDTDADVVAFLTAACRR